MAENDIVMQSSRMKRHTRDAMVGLAPRLGMSVAQFVEEAVQAKIEQHVRAKTASLSTARKEAEISRLVGLTNDMKG